MEIRDLLGIYYLEIHIAFIFTALVTLLYGIVAPWQRTHAGQYIFFLMGSLSLILGNSVARIYLKDIMPYSILFSMVFMLLYIVAIWVMGVGIYKATIQRYINSKSGKVEVD